ncbi:MAG: MmcQ/YjbR family DNA-binding protein [Flavobacteriaceae bacterium]|nr:MmcQ/YjbR family DNA-binding protein [Flavobacteriaceae bacterium]
MDILELRAYCLSNKATEEAMPFDQDTLVFKVLGKIFALTSLSDWEKGNPRINLKYDADAIESLREIYDFVLPGYHMNKKHWNTVAIVPELSDELLKAWIDRSYDLVVKSMPKKMQEQL